MLTKKFTLKTILDGEKSQYSICKPDVALAFFRNRFNTFFAHFDRSNSAFKKSSVYCVPLKVNIKIYGDHKEGIIKHKNA
jgi:hypothetical protein